MNKVKGHIATVYHAGSNSYYEATLIRKVSKQELIAVDKAASGEDPRPDGAIFSAIVQEVMGKRPRYFNDLNPSRTERRIKASFMYPNATQLYRLTSKFRLAFGDRFIDCDVTKERNVDMHVNSNGGELFLRLTAY